MSNNITNEITIKWSPLIDEDFILVGNSINFYRLTSIHNCKPVLSFFNFFNS